MSSYQDAVSDLNTLLFLTSAKCGHVLELMKQPEPDLPRIAGQLEMIEDQTRDIEQKISAYHISDNDLRGGYLVAIHTVVRMEIKPYLNKIKLKTNVSNAKAFVDEWLPTVNEILSFAEHSIKIAKEFKKS